MCLNTGGTVNSRGDTLSGDDYKKLGDVSLPGMVLNADPKKRAEMLTNWLTAGGKPQLPDVSRIFAEKEAGAPLEEKASAGQGINSLFGLGKLIGDIQPNKVPVGLEPPKLIEPMKPLNQSPMQPGVPYTALPIPGGR